MSILAVGTHEAEALPVVVTFTINDEGIESAASASPSYDDKTEGMVRGQVKTTHGHGCSGEDYIILQPRVGGS